MQQTILDEPSTWVKYSKKLCKQCNGNCCKLPVEVFIPDLIRMGFMSEFEIGENPKSIAKRLKKEGIIEHYNHSKEIFTITRLANGDCIFIDQKTRLCSIYESRPDTCRNHPTIGPRSGFCAFGTKTGH